MSPLGSRRFVPQGEPLGERVAPAVFTSFAGGVLSVSGDAADDTIVLSRRADGAILVNGATGTDTANGQAGNDVNGGGIETFNQ